jgi:hypothetical protein
MTPVCPWRAEARYGDADFTGGVDGTGGGLLGGAGAGLLAGGAPGTVTVEVGCTDGDGVLNRPAFRALCTRMAAITIATMMMMTMTMLRNVWSGRCGGPGGWPHPGSYGGPGGRP